MFIKTYLLNNSFNLSIMKLKNTVSVLGQVQGYTVKYTPSPEGVPEGKPRENS